MASELLSYLSQNKKENGLTGLLISLKRPTTSTVSKQMEEFDRYFLRQNRLISLRYLVSFCMYWWRSHRMKAKFAEGKIKPNRSVFALVSDYKKKIINQGFLQKKRSACFYSSFRLKGMGCAVRG